ncbi:MAG: hypothetical protein RIQ89_1253 [Bacteroidota bacterium]
MQNIFACCLVIGYSAFFYWCIGKFKVLQANGLKVWWLQCAFLTKVLSGVVLGLIYTFHYTDRATADTFKFFDDSRIMFDALNNEPYDFFRMFTGWDATAPDLRHYYENMYAWLNKDVLFNDNKTIIRLNTLFRFFSMGHYYVHVVFINMLSYIGLLLIYKTCVQYGTKSMSKSFFLVCFGLPSILFWGSGLLKDGLLLFALGLLLHSFNKLLILHQKKYLPYLIIALWMLVFTKLYIMTLLLPALICWWLTAQYFAKKPLWCFVIVYTIFLVAALNVHLLFPQYKIADLLYYKRANFYELVTATNANSVINIPAFEPTTASIAMHSPVAFFNALTRPWLTDVHNLLTLMAALEILVASSSFFWLCYKRGISFPKATPFYLFVGVFSISVLVLCGLITPVLGALVRYRMPIIPFILFMLLQLVNSKNESEEPLEN